MNGVTSSFSVHVYLASTVVTQQRRGQILKLIREVVDEELSQGTSCDGVLLSSATLPQGVGVQVDIVRHGPHITRAQVRELATKLDGVFDRDFIGSGEVGRLQVGGHSCSIPPPPEEA